MEGNNADIALPPPRLCRQGVNAEMQAKVEKEKGVVQGMHAGLAKYVPLNLKDIEGAGFKEGEEVSLESLKKKGVINPCRKRYETSSKAPNLGYVVDSTQSFREKIKENKSNEEYREVREQKMQLHLSCQKKYELQQIPCQKRDGGSEAIDSLSNKFEFYSGYYV